MACDRDVKSPCEDPSELVSTGLEHFALYSIWSSSLPWVHWPRHVSLHVPAAWECGCWMLVESVIGLSISNLAKKQFSLTLMVLSLKCVLYPFPTSHTGCCLLDGFPPSFSKPSSPIDPPPQVNSSKTVLFFIPWLEGSVADFQEPACHPGFSVGERSELDSVSQLWWCQYSAWCKTGQSLSVQVILKE